MNFGYIRSMATTPKVRVADVDFNKISVLRAISAAKESGAALLVLPELCLTGYTCGDLFYSGVLLSAALLRETNTPHGAVCAAALVLVCIGICLVNRAGAPKDAPADTITKEN